MRMKLASFHFRKTRAPSFQFPFAMVALLFIGPRLAFACFCSPSFSPVAKDMRELAKWEADQAKVLFEGQVERIEVADAPLTQISKDALSATFSGRHLIVTFRVLHVFRGPQESELIVLTGMGNGDCGYEFDMGGKYLVFAEEDPSGHLFTSICTATAPIEEAGPELRFLRGEPSAPEDLLSPDSYYSKLALNRYGKVCGTVHRRDGLHLHRLTVKLWRIRGKSIPPSLALADTKPNGGFCAYPLIPGKYVIRAEDGEFWKNWSVGYYPGTLEFSEAQTVEIKAGATVSGLSFSLQKQPLFHLRGRVVVVDGSTVLPDSVRIVLGNAEDDPLPRPIDGPVQADGSFEFPYVAPGRYSLTAYVRGPTAEGSTASKWTRPETVIVVSGDKDDLMLPLTLLK